MMNPDEFVKHVLRNEVESTTSLVYGMRSYEIEFSEDGTFYAELNCGCAMVVAVSGLEYEDGHNVIDAMNAKLRQLTGWSDDQLTAMESGFEDYRSAVYSTNALVADYRNALIPYYNAGRDLRAYAEEYWSDDAEMEVSRNG